jgi:hypothetical protein
MKRPRLLNRTLLLLRVPRLKSRPKILKATPQPQPKRQRCLKLPMAKMLSPPAPPEMTAKILMAAQALRDVVHLPVDQAAQRALGCCCFWALLWV